MRIVDISTKQSEVEMASSAFCANNIHHEAHNEELSFTQDETLENVNRTSDDTQKSSNQIKTKYGRVIRPTEDFKSYKYFLSFLTVNELEGKNSEEILQTISEALKLSDSKF